MQVGPSPCHLHSRLLERAAKLAANDDSLGDEWSARVPRTVRKRKLNSTALSLPASSAMYPHIFPPMISIKQDGMLISPETNLFNAGNSSPSTLVFQ